MNQEQKCSMTSDEYIKVFISHYKLVGLFAYKRVTGKNLIYKKVLIYVLRTYFHMTFTSIAKLFINDHANILYHYKNVCENLELEKLTNDAWELYRKDEHDESRG